MVKSNRKDKMKAMLAAQKRINAEKAASSKPQTR